MIPKPSYEKILAAMMRYDEEERGLPGADDWLQNGTYHYALENKGRLYPVKKIVAMADGTQVTDFSQSAGLRRYLEGLGLKVVDLGHGTVEDEEAEEDSEAEAELSGDSTKREGVPGTLDEWITEYRGENPFTKKLAHLYPKWLRSLHSEVHIVPIQQRGLSIRAAGEIVQECWFNPIKGFVYVVVHNPTKEDIELLRNRLSRTTSLKEFYPKDLGRHGVSAYRFYVRQDSDYLLLQDIAKRQLERILGEIGDGDGGEGASARQSVYWWVNQGSTYGEEKAGGYIWAPQKTKAGAKPFAHWQNMTKVRVGDWVLHYSNGAVRALGRVVEEAKDEGKPVDLTEGVWHADGWRVRIEYQDLEEPISLGKIPIELRAYLPGGPFNNSGGVNQGYLFPLPKAVAEWVAEQYGSKLPEEFVSGAQEARRRIVKIAPGEEARLWPECRDGGYICVGWDAVGDLRKFATKDEFREAFEQAYSEEYDHNASLVTKKANEVWTLTELEPGDLVVANDGTSKIVGVGTVTERGYEWIEDRQEFKHVVYVDWDTSYAKAIPEQKTWAFATVADVPEGLSRIILDTGGVAVPPQRVKPAPIIGPYVEPPFEEIRDAVLSRGMSISERTLRRYHLGLKTRGFVILSGVSGTGKTWLTSAYATAAGAEYLLVPVAPNWNTNEDLLGYWSPIDNEYHDTPFSRFLRKAADEYERVQGDKGVVRPYHLVLDEMNLARIEYYFAKFLSAMEVRARGERATLELAPGEEILLPPSLSFVGTVNVDETTHGFADKVYDRAQLIELEAPREALAAFVAGTEYGDVVIKVWDAVHEVAPFAFRVLVEIGAYLKAAEKLGVGWEEALDEQLLQKVLPKLKGVDTRIGVALLKVVEIAGERFSLTGAKAGTMLAGFKDHGFSSYF